MIHIDTSKITEIFEQKIANNGITDDLPLNDKRIIRFINIGAFIAGLFCLIIALFNIIIISDTKAFLSSIILTVIYFSIPYINRLQLFYLTKFVISIFLTMVVILWNLFITPTPYFIILPFSVANIFYGNRYIRLVLLSVFFSIFIFLKNTITYGNINIEEVELLSYDFFLFLMLSVIVDFTDINIKSYEQKMMDLNQTLKTQNEALEQQQQLKKSEQFFRSIFENNLLGLVVVKADNTLKNINPAFSRQLGFDSIDLIDKKITDLNLDTQKYESVFQQLVDGTIKNAELKGRFLRADDTVMHGEMILNGVYDKDDCFVEAFITIQDITETHKAEQALLENELKFKTLFDNSPVGITIRNVETDDITEINQTALDWANLTKEEFFAIKKERFLNKNTDIEKDKLILKPLIDGEVNTIVTEKIFKSNDGNDVYLEIIRSKMIINNVPFIIAISKNITETKLIEKERKIRYDEMQTFFDSLPISFLHLDKDNRILRANKLSGFGNPKMVEGQLMKDIYPTFTLENVRLHKQIFISGEPVIGEIENHKFNDINLWFKVDRVPIKDENGTTTGILIFSTNITSIKETEGQLAIKNAELEHYIETNLQLESFAYIASHDLKEPLRMIHSFTQLLNRRLKKHFDKDAEEYMDFVLDGVNRMQHLLDDLLKYSTIGRQETDLELTDLNDTIYNVIQNVQHTIMEKSAEIIIEPLPALKVYPMQMVQLFQNLISNALKFVPNDRKPVIEIVVKEDVDNYLFSVKDNGIGIQSEYLEKIFLVFKRLHGKEIYKGTGIGLATCKKIIETLNGKIWVESEYGEGTTFFFTIPIKNSNNGN